MQSTGWGVRGSRKVEVFGRFGVSRGPKICVRSVRRVVRSLARQVAHRREPETLRGVLGVSK